jgi:hypothetical protein
MNCNMKYRIMVEEKNSGEMGYTPQVKFNGWWNSWENIISDSRTKTSTCVTSRLIYHTQKQAEDVITLFKENQKEKMTESIKKITYINL